MITGSLYPIYTVGRLAFSWWQNVDFLVSKRGFFSELWNALNSPRVSFIGSTVSLVFIGIIYLLDRQRAHFGPALRAHAPVAVPLTAPAEARQRRQKLQPPPRPEPNLICLEDIGIRQLELTDNDIFHDVPGDDESLPSVVVRICNEPERDREVGSIGNVMARLVFIDPQGNRLAIVHYPYWVDEEYRPADFWAGTVRGLVIGWLVNVDADDATATLRTFENNHEGYDRYREPSNVDITFQERQRVRVQIRLYTDEFLKECEVWFQLDTREGGEGFTFGILSQPA